MVWSDRGGAGVCGEGSGLLKLQLEGGGWGGARVTERTKDLRQARNQKTQRVSACSFLFNFSLCFNPSPKLKAPLNAGSKPKAEHKPSTLTNLHPKPSQSSCRLQALYSHHPTRGRVYRHIWGTRPTLNPEKVGLRARVLSRAHTFRKQASKQDLFYTHTHIYI